MPPTLPVFCSRIPEGGEGRALAEGEPSQGLSVDVVHEAGDWGSLSSVAEAVKAASAAVAAELGLHTGEACVALSSDEHVARLNATYRGKPSPTNVLSFPSGAPRSEAMSETEFLGDIVLAAETVTREADALGLPLIHHLQHLVVHGLLHLLGFDHESDEEAEVMESLEVRILARLGLSNPYEEASEPLAFPQSLAERTKTT